MWKTSDGFSKIRELSRKGGKLAAVMFIKTSVK
jgi:hypothetical protein